MYKLKGGVSGGTLVSAISAIEEVPKAFTIEAMKDFSYRERETLSPHSGNKVTPLTPPQQKGLPLDL